MTLSVGPWLVYSNFFVCFLERCPQKKYTRTSQSLRHCLTSSCYKTCLSYQFIPETPDSLHYSLWIPTALVSELVLLALWGVFYCWYSCYSIFRGLTYILHLKLTFFLPLWSAVRWLGIFVVLDKGRHWQSSNLIYSQVHLRFAWISIQFLNSHYE